MMEILSGQGYVNFAFFGKGDDIGSSLYSVYNAVAKKKESKSHFKILKPKEERKHNYNRFMSKKITEDISFEIENKERIKQVFESNKEPNTPAARRGSYYPKDLKVGLKQGSNNELHSPGVFGGPQEKQVTTYFNK